MKAFQFVNSAASTLLLPISATDQTCQLFNAAPFLPLSGWQVWLIEDEMVVAQEYSAGVFTIARGAEGTIPAAHSTGVPVYAHCLSRFDQRVRC
jgi:hypothetical protein